MTDVYAAAQRAQAGIPADRKAAARYAALLGAPSFVETTGQRAAAAAIDEARARLQGGERPPADQLSLDLRRP